MIYYNSRYLSSKLQINLARWKRWAREFLPPDPLGGIQSGVTRQFNAKEAFKVYLAGHLVGALKLTIPDAAKILNDLKPWLKSQGFFQIHARSTLNGARDMPQHYLFIYPGNEQQFSYCIRTVIQTEIVENDILVKRTTFSETHIRPSKSNGDEGHPVYGHVIAVTRLYTDFLNKIEVVY